MKKVEIEDFKKQCIDKHGLNTNIYNLYYDERGITKLYIKDDGELNNNYFGTFTLGGIGSSNIITVFEPLKRQMELKSKDILKGNFIEIINEPLIFEVLKVMKNNNIYIHFNFLDVLYYSIVGIIDNVFPPFICSMEIKNILWKYFKKENNIDLIKNSNYPSFESKKEMKEFYNEIFQIIKISLNTSTHKDEILFHLKLMEQLLDIIDYRNLYFKSLRENVEYDFLIELIVFGKSNLYFDNQEKIQKELKTLIKEDNVTFIDSNSDINIQISDLVVGLMGRFMEYINDYPLCKCINDIRGKAFEENSSVKLFLNILKYSVEKDKYFKNMSAPMHNNLKYEYLIQMPILALNSSRIVKNYELFCMANNYDIIENEQVDGMYKNIK